MAARFWGSGLIDRTKTLYTGFPFEILYPMPRSHGGGDIVADLPTLCDESGRRIVQEAVNADKKIQVLWSGGIDSTTALVGLIKATTAADCPDRLEVTLTEESVNEYPDFYQRFIKQLRFRFVSAPVTSHLDPKKLIVTGEHGDQIFGSAKAAKYVADGRAFDDYQTALPPILHEDLGSAAKADEVVRYIEPLLDTCPIQLKTIYDAFWWLNFTLKWQIVGLRLAVFRVNDVLPTFNALRHYYSHSSFQRWSLANHDKKIQTSWESYKMPLKDYIYEFTADEEYRQSKIKVPSLKAVFQTDAMARPPAYRVLMDETFQPVFWQFTRKGKHDASLRLSQRNRGR